MENEAVMRSGHSARASDGREAVAMAVHGLGIHLPEAPTTNEDICRRYGSFVATISEEMGVDRRHWSADPKTGLPREDNATISTRAAEAALAEAGMAGADIDLIVVATVSADYMFPGPAGFVQDRIGAGRAEVIDLRAGCFGMAQGLRMAQQYLAAGASERVLVVGSEVLSPLLHVALRYPEQFRPRQRAMLRVTAALFGDGAGAMVLGRSDAIGESCILSCRTHSVGCGRTPGIYGAVGGTKMPVVYSDTIGSAEVMHHDYSAIERFYPEVATRLFDSFGDRLAERLGEYAVIVPAQANGQIRSTLSEVLRKRCGSEKLADETHDKVFIDIADVGNTGAASIYIALDKVRRTRTGAGAERILLVPAEATKWYYAMIEMIA